MTPRHRTQRLALIGLAGALATLATACTQHTTSQPAAAGSPTGKPAATSPAAAPAPTTPAPTSSAGAAQATTTGTAACATSALRVALGGSEGAAGSTYLVIRFTNVSGATCSLYGFPGVSLVGGSPVAQIGLAAAETAPPARRLVALAPGQSAHAILHMVDAENYPRARCGQVQSSGLRVYPPNQTTPVDLRYTAPACSKKLRTLSVTVVQRGAAQNY